MPTIQITEALTTVTVTEVGDEEIVTLTEAAPTVVIEDGAGLQGATGPVGPVGPSGPGLPIPFMRSGVLTPITGEAVYPIGETLTLTGYTAAVRVAPLGSALTAAIKVNDIAVTTVTIPAGETFADVPMNVPVTVGDYVSVDILTVGATPAESLTILIRYE